MKYAVDRTVEYIKFLARQMEDWDISCVILVVLMDLGIPTNCDGFEYLKEAVLMRYEDPLCTAEADIYPRLIEKYKKHLTNKQIETSIRYAIQCAWSNRRENSWEIYLPGNDLEQGRQPCNTAVIYGIARILELYSGCAKAYSRQRCREEVGCGIE